MSVISFSEQPFQVASENMAIAATVKVLAIEWKICFMIGIERKAISGEPALKVNDFVLLQQ